MQSFSLTMHPAIHTCHGMNKKKVGKDRAIFNGNIDFIKIKTYKSMSQDCDRSGFYFFGIRNAICNLKWTLKCFLISHPECCPSL